MRSRLEKKNKQSRILNKAKNEKQLNSLPPEKLDRTSIYKNDFVCTIFVLCFLIQHNNLRKDSQTAKRDLKPVLEYLH